MRTYRRLWLCWWGGLGALGLLLGLGRLSVLTVVGVFLGLGLVAGTVTLLPGAIDNNRQLTTPEIGRSMQRGFWGALVVVTVVVAAFSFGALVWPLLVLVAVSSPWAVRSAVRLAVRPHAQQAGEEPGPGCPEPAAVALSAGDRTAAVQALTDDELCARWRTSYPAMQAASLTTCAELVSWRQAYLEDLERRNPEGMRAWLDSGAAAAGDPARYLATGRG